MVLLCSLLAAWLVSENAPVANAGMAAELPPDRPNIVLILADDLGMGDLGCYNPESKIPTPNLDRLAKAGMRFTDAHSPAAVCTPTRYAILTGRYCWRTQLKRGVLQGYDPLLIEDGRLTIAELLRRAGYRTGAFGKWHLGFGRDAKLDYANPFETGPLTVGFDEFFGIPSSLDFPPYVFVDWDRPTEQPTAQIAESRMRRFGGGGFWRSGAIGPSFRHEDVLPRITERAVRFVQQQDASRPFFLYFPLSAPHTPWMPGKRFQGRSKAGWYGDFVVQVDDAVGQVMAALKRRGLEKNTLVVLTSDNGAHWTPADIARFGHRSNMDWRGQKADIYEAGHRVPFLVRWPGRVEVGKVSDRLVCLLDLYRTFAESAGVPVPSGQGEDSYTILGAPASRPAAVIHHSGNGVFAIREGDWKLILGLGSGGFTMPREETPVPGGPMGQLYNLREDPGELRNLYKERPGVVARLERLLAQIQSGEGR